MSETMTRLGAGGRIVVPAAYRKALEMRSGDALVITLDDGELRIVPLRRAIQRAQARVRRYVPAGVSLAEELLAERRAQADVE